MLLPKVWARFLSPRTRIYYCHTKHRLEITEEQFFEAVTAEGLELVEVREPGVQTPPPSPPPLTELFPEMRLVIYRVQWLSIKPSTVA
jgi:hypothetical protein